MMKHPESTAQQERFSIRELTNIVEELKKMPTEEIALALKESPGGVDIAEGLAGLINNEKYWKNLTGTTRAETN